MPHFRNTTRHDLAFDAGDLHFAVPPGAVCAIDQRVKYIVHARGLPLVEVPSKDLTRAELRSVVEGVSVPPPRPRRVRGVASGNTVNASEDGDDVEGDVVRDAPALPPVVEPSPEDEGPASLPVPADARRALAARKPAEG